jgi:hypothetical protein
MLGSDDDPKYREAVSIAPDFNPVSIPVWDAIMAAASCCCSP